MTLLKHASHDQSTHGNWARWKREAGDYAEVPSHYLPPPDGYYNEDPATSDYVFADVTEEGKDTIVLARTYGGGAVGYMKYRRLDDGRIHLKMVRTNPKFERMGVATWLTETLFALEGVDENDIKADFTDEGAALWNRRFGTDVKPNTSLAKAILRIKKHPGPGGSATHGTGTDQSVHGSGGGSGREIRVPRPKVQPGETEFWGRFTRNANMGMVMHDLLQHGKADLPEKGISLTTDTLLRPTNPTVFTPKDNLSGFTVTATDANGKRTFINSSISNGRYGGTIVFPGGSEATVTSETSLGQFVDDLGRTGLSFNTGLPPTPTTEQLQLWEPGWDELPPMAVGQGMVSKNDFGDARAVFYGTSSDAPPYSHLLNAETAASKENVAWLMEHGSHGARLELEIQETYNDMREMQHSFLDEVWEEVYGTPGNNGEGTWRMLMGPQQVTGQTKMGIATEGGYTPNITNSKLSYAETWLVVDPNQQGYRPPYPVDPDDPLDVNDWILDLDEDDQLARDYIGSLSTPKKFYQNPLIDRYRVRLHDHFDSIGTTSTGDEALLPLEILNNLPRPGTDYTGNKYSTIVHYLREQWAESSTHPNSLAVQMAADEMFNLDGDTEHWQYAGDEWGNGGASLQDAEALRDRFPALYEAYVDSVYTNTQVRLENAGITHVPVTRGMGLSPSDFGDTYYPQRYGPERYSLKRWDTSRDMWVEFRAEDNPLGWYSTVEEAESAIDALGVRMPDLDTWTPISYDLQPLSAFSLAPFTAAGFASSDHKEFSTVSRMLVPKERIWATSLDGFGSMRETEFIVLGGKDLDAEIVITQKGDMPKFIQYEWDGPSKYKQAEDEAETAA